MAYTWEWQYQPVPVVLHECRMYDSRGNHLEDRWLTHEDQVEHIRSSSGDFIPTGKTREVVREKLVKVQVERKSTVLQKIQEAAAQSPCHSDETYDF